MRSADWGTAPAAEQVAKEAGAMTVYLGYYRPVPDFDQETQDRARRGESGFDPSFLRMVQELSEKLPAGCRILGSYVPMGGGAVLSEPGAPAVMLVESETADDLAVITRHYSGYLTFLWTPATVIGATRSERDAWAEAAAGPAGARRS